MKCGIVTVYNSENAGSFLQAMAMTRAIQSMGHEAVCMYQGFSDHSASFRNYSRRLLGTIVKKGPSAARLLVQRRKLFRKAHQLLTVETDAERIDCFLLGSDVIWDVKERFFRDHRDFFWGTGYAGARVISYAPSVGFAEAEDLERCGFVAEALSQMDAVSVRDVTSQRLLQPYSQRPVRVVCDPTLLIGPQEYEVLEKPTELEDFIFLYCYETISAEYTERIKAFAKARGLKTVTFGSSNPWCDLRLAYDPLLFLSLYRKAAYIVTDTFHGTVFSNIYEKKYVVLNNQKPKILDFLSLCQMSDKMTQTAEDLARILSSEYDYDTTWMILEKERENGLNYLKNALKERA